MNANKRPVTRSLVIVDKILSILILIMGLIIMYLAIQYGSYSMALASLIFVAIGFIKIRNLFPGIFRSVRKGSAREFAPYKKVLLPISRKESIENLIELAENVIEPDGQLDIINIVEVPPQLPPEADVKKENARALLRVALDYAEKYKLNSRGDVISARTAADAIIDMSKSYRSDLVIMGSSQRTMTEKMLFGNVADIVLRHAPCDIMVLSYMARQHPIRYSKILVPTAGYRHSHRALDVAIDITKKNGGTITSLYVGPEPEAEKGRQILEEARQRAEKSGVKVGSKFMSGGVVESVVSLAKEDEYSLIIIGATEHPRYYTALLGTIADGIVKKAPCDVLVVRTRG
ncbi:MAG TPA: universal stress protein [Methanocella sp.]|nr:universal stress protein [Methanocella sp.]